MNRDLRGTPLFEEAAALLAELRAPGSGRPFDAADISVLPDGSGAVFTGHFLETLETPATTRICSMDFTTSKLTFLTNGPADKLPRVSPDGTVVALVSSSGDTA